MCAEPMEGIAFFLECLEADGEALEKERGMSCTGVLSVEMSLMSLQNKIVWRR